MTIICFVVFGPLGRLSEKYFRLIPRATVCEQERDMWIKSSVTLHVNIACYTTLKNRITPLIISWLFSKTGKYTKNPNLCCTL